MNFCTVINCMDGRVQLPVIKYLQTYFKAEYVDSITEAGPIAGLAQGLADSRTEGILKKLRVSADLHRSLGLAVIAHHDCAGNPVEKEVQLEQLRASIVFLKEKQPNLEIIGLWVDTEHLVHKIY